MVDYHYQLTIVVEHDIRKQLIDDECSLCLKKFLKENQDQPVANVAFAAKAFNKWSKTTVFSWNDFSSIGAASEGFSKGKIAPQGTCTDVEDISTRRSAFLGPNWNDFKVKDDNEAPRNGFGFHITDDTKGGAAAVVYMRASLDGAEEIRSPYFISNSRHEVPSFTTLVPCERIMICFEKGATHGTMTTHVSKYDRIIDLTDEEPKQTWKLSNARKWEKETPK